MRTRMQRISGELLLRPPFFPFTHTHFSPFTYATHGFPFTSAHTTQFPRKLTCSLAVWQACRKGT